jgi:proline iminopeptidase
MVELYPPIEPYEHGMLDVGDGNHVYWELCGNPRGKPAAFVHGGPGQGCVPNMRRAFHPDRYRVVLFDQRGCGRSVPHASDPATDMSVNTTWHLVDDMERLREHLGIERWLLSGGSWGSTLMLAYAQRHPERVSEMLISAVTTSRKAEINWLYRGVGRFFPEEWQRFREVVPAADRDGDLVAAYARLMEHPDPRVRAKAANAWCAWEDAVLSLEPGFRSSVYSDHPPASLLAFVRITAHYYAHGAWLEDGALLRDAHRLAGIPAVLIHGRLDLSCPLDSAWELARRWPDARLIALADSGHLASASKRAAMLATLDEFATGEREEIKLPSGALPRPLPSC